MNKTLRSLLLEAEAKVKAAGLAATGCGVAIAVLNDVEAHHQMLGSLPEWTQTALLSVIPGAITYLSAWATKHATQSTAATDPPTIPPAPTK